MGRFSALLALLPALATAQDAPQLDMPLYIISSETQQRWPNAKCLDGSLPGYYWRNATTAASATKWRIHQRGGGWCMSLADCASRAATGGGGTGSQSPFFGGENADWGLLSNASTSPVGDWHGVFVVYCDANSQTSAVDGPVTVGNQTLWFRGFDVLNAVYEDLEVRGGLKSRSTDVILAGTSAGGMSTYIHAPYIRSLLPASANVVALPDAGAFMDAQDAEGAYSWRASLQQSFALWNASAGANAKCMAAYKTQPSEQWRCITPQYAYYYNDAVPTFIMQSMYDSAQQGIVERLPCNFAAGACNATWRAYSDAYAEAMYGNLTAIAARYGDRDGWFFTSCGQHEETCMNYDFGDGTPGVGITLQGQTALDTFWKWYNRQGSVADWRRRDVPWPGDATCQPYGARHGGC